MVLGEPVGWTERIGDLGAGERQLGSRQVQLRGVVERSRRSGNRRRCPWRWWRGEGPGPGGGASSAHRAEAVPAVAAKTKAAAAANAFIRIPPLLRGPLVRRNAEYVPHDLIQFSFGTLIHLRGCLARLSSAQYVYLVAATSRVPLERASSISQRQCPIRVELTRSGLASGTVGPAATLAFTLSPLSGAYRPFIRPISKGSSGSN